MQTAWAGRVGMLAQWKMGFSFRCLAGLYPFPHFPISQFRRFPLLTRVGHLAGQHYCLAGDKFKCLRTWYEHGLVLRHQALGGHCKGETDGLLISNVFGYFPTKYKVNYSKYYYSPPTDPHTRTRTCSVCTHTLALRTSAGSWPCVWLIGLVHLRIFVRCQDRVHKVHFIMPIQWKLTNLRSAVRGLRWMGK